MQSTLLLWLVSKSITGVSMLPSVPLDATVATTAPQPARSASENTWMFDANATERFVGAGPVASSADALTSSERAELSSAPPAADEEAYPNLYRKFSLSLGLAAYANFDTQLKVSGNSVGADLDLENLLGLNESSSVGRLDGEYSFNKRHRIAFSYYDIGRDGQRTITNPINVGNVTIPAGSVDTMFDTTITKLAYNYNFVTDERTVIGASFGLHVMGIDTKIETTGGSVSESFRVDAPLPVLGFHGSYALSKRWSLSASAEILQFDIGDYRGFVGDNRLTIDHELFDHFGWGLGFNGFNVNASFEGSSGLTADLDYGYQGVFLYLRTFF